MKILLVEDNELNLMLLQEIVQMLYPNVTIETAINGQFAYEILKEQSFDLILSDINMPVLDGYSLIKKIKEELQLSTPVIAVTAFAIRGDKEKILLAGFDEYISKPIDMSELEKALANYLPNA